MKRYIKISEEGSLTNKDMVEVLKSMGIDTTMSQYELRAEEYERYSSGTLYAKKFKCPGDWLAYLSMAIHGTPNAEQLGDHFDVYTKEDFEEFASDYPTVEDMKDCASSCWWGDGDDYIIYLKNLTTGETLYQGDSDYYEDEEDEDW